MTSKRSTSPRNAGSLQRMLAEKEALLSERERIIAEKETQLAERDRLIAMRDAELYAKTLQIEHLKAQLAVLRRTRFGRSSEKLDREIEQLELLLGELEEGVAESNARAEQAEQEPASPRRATPKNHKPTGRKPLPAHLPREQVTHMPQGACNCCGGTVLRKIGEDVTEVLEYVPSAFKVIQHLRPKLNCRACETIVQAPPPSLPIGAAGRVRAFSLTSPWRNMPMACRCIARAASMRVMVSISIAPPWPNGWAASPRCCLP